MARSKRPFARIPPGAYTVFVAEIALDDYVFDVLMRDLVGHDKSPSAFLVYLHIWSQTLGKSAEDAPLSHQKMAEATGLSKSAVQSAIRILLRRRLVRAHKSTITSTPEYRVLRPWLRAHSPRRG